MNARQCRSKAISGAFLVLLLLSPVPGAAQSQPGEAELHLQVIDENGQPTSRVEVVLDFGRSGSRAGYTDSAGQIELRNLYSGQIHLKLSKPGFFRIDDRAFDLAAGINQISLTLNHETELQETLEVESQPIQIDPDTTSHQESLVQHEIVNTPVPASHDLQQSLRTIPQVLADTNGGIHVAGARQGQTEVLLDGFEINDPASGGFTSRVNVDAVRSSSIETGGYGVQYAHAGAGILALDTLTGDDRWRFGITNFFPEVNFQEGMHFGNWYPRVTFSGPMKKGKAWFSEASSIQHSFKFVNELPRGQNIDVQWSGDSLLRAQVNLSSRNILQGSFLFNGLKDPHQGLGIFSPLSTTLNYQAQRYFVSVKDQVWFGRGLFDIGAAIDTGRSDSHPQGSSPYIVTPSNASGDYFQSLSQKSRRLQLMGNITTSSLNWHGAHALSAGWNAEGLDFSQQASRTQIDYLRANGTLSEIATFSGAAAFHTANTQLGGYAQDLWRPVKPIVITVGARIDWDRLIHKQIVAPRVALNWVPAGDGRMKFTLAWGEHYQPLNLSLLSQGFDQQRSDVFYDQNGQNPGLPIVSSFLVRLNRLSQPRSYNTTAEWQARFFDSTFVGASFLGRELRDGLAWESQPDNSLILKNNRHDHYLSGEFWVRHAFNKKAQIQVNYTRSRATSSEVLDPTLALLILAPQQRGPLLWDAPNRVVGTGWTPIPLWGLLLSGLFEYRTGFPFSALNELQQLVGAPNRLRFPDYVSLNLGLEKRFPFRGHEWAFRVSGINITGHNNPDSVVNNVDAPTYLTFAGGQRRAFTARLRLVTQH